jgi:cytoskeleton protein RodZ
MSRKRRRPDRRRPFGSYAVRVPQASPGDTPAADPHTTEPAHGHADGHAHAPPASEVAHAAPAPDPVAPELPLEAATSLGMRLRSARTGLGKSLEEVARETRIPVNVLSDIEHDRFDRLGAPVFARGYLRGFARSVGIPESLATATLDTSAEVPPPLVATQRTSRSRYLASRYAPPVAYALLTLVVLVPLLTSLGPALSPAPRLEPIDAPVADLAPSTPVDVPLAASNGPAAPSDPPSDEIFAEARDSDVVATGVADGAADPAPEPQQPMMASMAPMPERVASPQSPKRVVLRLAQQSWVEITGTDGQRIEYSLLPAGSVREYQIAGRAEMRIGNSRAADLSVDGRRVDLAAFSRLNVARVEVGTDADR